MNKNIVPFNDPNEYFIDYENNFPFILYLARDMASNIKTPIITRCDYKFCTIEYVVSGSGTLQIGGQEFHIRKDSVYFLPQGSDHVYWPDPNDPWQKMFFVTGGVMMNLLMKAYHLEKVYHIPDCPELKKYFEVMKALYRTTTESNQEAAVVFHQFAAHASKVYSGLRSQIPREIEKLKQRLDASVQKKFVLEEYAAEKNLSGSHLIRTFSAYYKITPYDYLMAQKMERAKALLQYSSMSIKEIADQLAFSDQYYFSNYFKRKNGMSPKEFREKMGAS